MLNELYTFAEPVQVVPFSSLKWGKFTLLHTDKLMFISIMSLYLLVYNISLAIQAQASASARAWW